MSFQLKRKLTMENNLAIACRPWSKSTPVFWVQDLKERKGDWGYTTNSSEALALTPYQQARFASDCKKVGVTASFVIVRKA